MKKLILIPCVLIICFSLYQTVEKNSFKSLNQEYLDALITDDNNKLRTLLNKIEVTQGDLEKSWLKAYIYVDLKEYSNALQVIQFIYNETRDYRTLLRICMLKDRVGLFDENCYNNVILNFRHHNSDYYNLENYWYAVFLSGQHSEIIKNDLEKTHLDKERLNYLQNTPRKKLIYDFFPE
ncbi:hypothetical protein SAMN05660772_02349 [Pasteurella testudinis DSM 23072]|uniref:Uncharacterized protein n=1 Tax=Pasteurella testudinis DSM 23072 TaxID=1122938 RepID=A0A1W1UVI5_9PAST|nr:hypothetical protein [Pasteurella testudinis]SMB84801.1 hypothetical protein SAMN05660772_02349 [Pasteurella testudinis DSM 23072]SUB51264.1 Uncharacterised protein [Pasteurella testudinis]